MSLPCSIALNVAPTPAPAIPSTNAPFFAPAFNAAFFASFFVAPFANACVAAALPTFAPAPKPIRLRGSAMTEAARKPSLLIILSSSFQKLGSLLNAFCSVLVVA